jgi:hypothetical protein
LLPDLLVRLENTLPRSLPTHQGDQIGRNFAQYVRPLDDCLLFNTVYRFFLENYRSDIDFFQRLGSCKILTKNGLGYILGDFFNNSSGHLATHAPSFVSWP